MWGMKGVTVILVMVIALRTMSTGFEKYVTAVGIEMKVEHSQNIALLETATILRPVLGC